VDVGNLENRKTKMICAFAAAFGVKDLFQLHIAAMTASGVLAPSLPYPALPARAADIKLP
jgi:hypothetical protein